MNESTFPTTEANYASTKWSYEGITIRDYFAIKAMQGFVASMRESDDFIQLSAEWCYKVADLMLKERSKQ